jgi:hypothetical protein
VSDEEQLADTLHYCSPADQIDLMFSDINRLEAENERLRTQIATLSGRCERFRRHIIDGKFYLAGLGTWQRSELHREGIESEYDS